MVPGPSPRGDQRIDAADESERSVGGKQAHEGRAVDERDRKPEQAYAAIDHQPADERGHQTGGTPLRVGKAQPHGRLARRPAEQALDADPHGQDVQEGNQIGGGAGSVLEDELAEERGLQRGGAGRDLFPVVEDVDLLGRAIFTLDHSTGLEDALVGEGERLGVPGAVLDAGQAGREGDDEQQPDQQDVNQPGRRPAKQVRRREGEGREIVHRPPFLLAASAPFADHSPWDVPVGL